MMALEKISGSRAVTAVRPVQRSAQKEASDAFEDILEDLRRSDAADDRDDSAAEGDAVFTRLLSDGSVLVQVYRGSRLISETRMRGAHAAVQQQLMRSIAGPPRSGTSLGRAPLLASRAAQGAGGVAALVNRAV